MCFLTEGFNAPLCSHRFLSGHAVHFFRVYNGSEKLIAEKGSGDFPGMGSHTEPASGLWSCNGSESTVGELIYEGGQLLPFVEGNK